MVLRDEWLPLQAILPALTALLDQSTNSEQGPIEGTGCDASGGPMTGTRFFGRRQLPANEDTSHGRSELLQCSMADLAWNMAGAAPGTAGEILLMFVRRELAGVGVEWRLELQRMVRSVAGLGYGDQ